MASYKDILNEGGQDLLDLVLVVYVNFYFSELEIIDLCGKWIPRRSILKEKFYLVSHASDEVSHATLFKDGVKGLGIEWNNSLIDQYRLNDIDSRFAKLLQSDDELEVLIGLNIYAEGVLAMEELVEMAKNRPEYFPSFARIAREEATHLAFGKTVLKRMLADDDGLLGTARQHCDWYRDHLRPYLWKDISRYIDVGIRNGVLDHDFRDRTVSRFVDEMASIGLNVAWPAAAPRSAASA